MNEAPLAPMPTSSPKSLWIVALIVVVAAVALLFVFLAHNKVSGPIVVVPPKPILRVYKKDLTSDQIPDKFPAELVKLEVGCKLTQNYNASAADGRFQATRACETTKTLADQIKIYRDYLAKNSWNIQDTLDQDTVKVVIANKNDAQILVVADENATTHIRTVTVTATSAQPLANSSGH